MQHFFSSRIYREDLAYIHDAGFGDLAREAAPAVIDTLRSSGLTQGMVIELGCGTGILLASFSTAGYQVIGIDSSEQMLELARVKAPAADLRYQSMYDADIPPCSAVVATGEALNYEMAGHSNVQRLPSMVTRIFQQEAIERVLIDSGFAVQIRAGYGTNKLPPGRRLFEARKPR